MGTLSSVVDLSIIVLSTSLGLLREAANVGRSAVGNFGRTGATVGSGLATARRTKPEGETGSAIILQYRAALSLWVGDHKGRPYNHCFLHRGERCDGDAKSGAGGLRLC